MDDPFFANPAWVHHAPVAAAEDPMDLSRHDQGSARLLAWADAWCRQRFAWVEIMEGPGEHPLICPHDRYAYRLVARLPPYPHGVWVHVVVDRTFALVAVRVDPAVGDDA